MRILDWLKSAFGKEPKKTSDLLKSESFRTECINLYIQHLAFYSCVNRIASCFCKCEFKTYFKGKEVKDVEWYLWNVQPNKNENASAFKNKLINRLYDKNEVLIIDNNGELLIADSYTKTEYALYGDIFSSISIKGYTFNKTFSQEDVIYIKLNDQNIRKLLNGMASAYQDLITTAFNSYVKSKGSKIALNISQMARNDPKFDESFKKMLERDFKNYFSPGNSVMPLFEGYAIEDKTNDSAFSMTTRDIRSLIDDITDYTARAIGFPPSLAKGDVQDTTKAVDELLTFCLDPLVKNIGEEINRKRNGLYNMRQKTYLKIDTKAIKHIDLMDVATAVDKLISSGCFTVNDIRRACGEEELDEEWANTFFMTKNYSTVEELMKAMKGGEGNEEDVGN